VQSYGIAVGFALIATWLFWQWRVRQARKRHSD